MNYANRITDKKFVYTMEGKHSVWFTFMCRKSEFYLESVREYVVDRLDTLYVSITGRLYEGDFLLLVIDGKVYQLEYKNKFEWKQVPTNEK